MNRGPVQIAPGLTGELSRPTHAGGVVLLVDGGEDGREQRRHRFVTGFLQRSQLATLLLDPSGETAVRQGPAGETERIQRLAHDLLLAIDRVQREPSLASLELGLFGSGCGAAAAIVCAAERPLAIAAIVSLAAPLQLVASDITRLRTPTMFVVGASDSQLLEPTQSAYRAAACDKRLEIVPRATHLFEEAGAMERVAVASGDWFGTWLRPRGT